MKANELKSLMLDITKRQSFDILHQSIEGVNCENSIRVAFLGEFSTGKSTLVNALIKQRLIPMLDKPTNANPIEINAAYENSFEISRWVEDEEVLQVIQQDRLQDEVINYETGKRVYLHLKDCSILNNDVVLIDTPGISSLLEHHTDVTFGYLPIIDAAVFVISALPGSATNSVLDFIEEQISPIKGLKNRLFFCISMLDAIPQESREKVCEEIKQSIEKVVQNPRIAVISPKLALGYATSENQEAEYETEVEKLVQFIHVDLIARKKQIQAENLCKLLRPLQEKLIHQLKTKQVSLNYSTAELDAKLEDTQAQIDHLQRLTLQYRKDIEKAEELILDDIKFDQESLIDAIAVKAANDEDFSGDIQDFSDKVSSIFERRYRNLEIPTNAGSERLGSIIDNKLSPAISSINQTMDMVANLVTVVVSIYLIPGKTALDAAGAGAVLAQEASKSAMKAAAGKAALLAAKGAILKGMAFLVHVLGKLNPVEGIKDLAKMPVLKAMLKSKLNKITLSLLNHVFDNLRDELEVHILETYTRPIEQHNETLKNIKRDINAGFEDMDRLRESIKDDIQSLMTNDC